MSDLADKTITALRTGHDELAALVSSMTPDDLTQPSAAEEWTISQVLSHLGSGAEINTSCAAKSVDIGLAIGSSPTAAGISQKLPYELIGIVDNIGPAEDMIVRQAANIKSPADFKGKKKVLNIYPSIDTPVCALSTRKFNEHAKAHADASPRAQIQRPPYCFRFRGVTYCIYLPTPTPHPNA